MTYQPFKNKNQAFLASWVAEIQEFEDAIFDVRDALTFQGTYGDAENKLGAIVDEKRLGRSDPDYLAAIQVRILVNRSKGRATDLIKIANAVFEAGAQPVPGEFFYSESYPMKWEIFAVNAHGFPQIAQLFGRAKAPGSYGVLAYTTWPADEDFRFSSSYGGAGTPLGFSSIYGGTTGGNLAAAAVASL